MGVKFSFAKIFVFYVKLCLQQSILLSFFLLNKTFLQFSLFTKSTMFSETYLYQVCQTYSRPQYFDFQQKCQYQPKLTSLTLPRHLQKPTLEFHLRLRCSVDYTVPKHYGLTRTLSIIFPIVHIYAVTFYFHFVDF